MTESFPASTVERPVHADGHKVFVQRLLFGASDVPPIVFLHEALGAITMWKDIPRRLCTALGRDGVVYDRWGHGRADPLDGSVRGARLYDYHGTEAEALRDLLDAEEIERAVLFGHSDGGTVALLAAALMPERIAAVVTLAAHVFVEDISVAGIEDAVAAYTAPDSRLRAALLRHHGAERAERIFYAWADTWCDPGFRDWNIEAQLAGVACPVLTIQGADDEYGSPAQVEAIVRGVRGPAKPLLIEGCGHAPHAESPEVVIEAMREFLATVTENTPSLS